MKSKSTETKPSIEFHSRQVSLQYLLRNIGDIVWKRLRKTLF